MCAAWAYARAGTHTANIGFNADTELFVAAFLRRVTIPVRVKRRRTHRLRRSLEAGADSDGSIALFARFVTAAVFVVAPAAQCIFDLTISLVEITVRTKSC